MTDTKDYGPAPYVVDIEKDTLDNPNFRTTRWTGKNIQLTLMTILVGGDIGLEVHETHDQFLRLEQGTGRVQMGPTKDQLSFEREVRADWAVFVPAGTWHNITNIGVALSRVHCAVEVIRWSIDRVKVSISLSRSSPPHLQRNEGGGSTRGRMFSSRCGAEEMCGTS